MSRWWRTSERTLEDERAGFAAHGLDFALDEDFLAEHDVVMFRGRLRRAGRTQPATIIYPPGYGEGEHPQVFAPEVPLGRHWRPGDGVLCLDHLDPGDDRPMTGAEAALRAENLWRLVEEDPDELARVEVNAPFPAADLYRYSPGSLVYLLAADTGDHREGWARLDATLGPLRGQITALGTSRGGPKLPLDVRNGILGGPIRLLGAWRRIDESPPTASLEATCDWIRSHHGDLMQFSIGLAEPHRHISPAATQTFVAFVFPDEGPAKGQTHDAWLLVRLDLDTGNAALVKVAPLARDDQYLRQPGMSGLVERKVLLVGAGALGSQIAAQLARAGIGAIDVIDPDELDPGNVVRHELTLREAAFPKPEALVSRLLAINPYLDVRTSRLRVGSVGGLAIAAEVQKLHDEWAEQIVGANLVVNATASAAPGRWLASLGDALRVPVLHVAVSAGAWGARIHAQRPGISGCPECLARHQAGETNTTVPRWSEDPDGDTVVGRGCSQPTFAAPGFELSETASAATRVAVQTLLNGEGYPALDYAVATLTFRDADRARPTTEYTPLPRHPDCRCCAP